MYCDVCENEVRPKHIPVDCGAPNQKYCKYKGLWNNQAYLDPSLKEVAECLEKMNYTNRNNLQSWSKNMTNGAHFNASISEIKQEVRTRSENRDQTQELASALMRVKLRYNNLPGQAFGGGYWSLALDGGVLVQALSVMHDMCQLAVKAFDNNGHDNRTFAKYLQGMYVGEKEAFIDEFLTEAFEDLLAAIKSGKCRNKAFLFAKASADGCESKTRTLGYVRLEAGDNGLHGDLVGRNFRCINVTETGLQSADADFPGLPVSVRVATTLLHEFTHIVLKTKDHATAGGRDAYGRQLCSLLAWELTEGKHTNDPCTNADTLAFIACDLYCLVNNLFTLEKLDQYNLNKD